ncbi:hypothetical protein PF008_g12862 [Phytophthora fragariae]|uniref:Uncharacterized protein n=1 Tax=Phytophthora fragariae TaxID=53985 RepID=A0A6G0RMI4_9STRA|nr:hypothetical protein PF008_g12862 [Phytophthora fragariae]
MFASMYGVSCVLASASFSDGIGGGGWLESGGVSASPGCSRSSCMFPLLGVCVSSG